MIAVNAYEGETGGAALAQAKEIVAVESVVGAAGFL
jgi:hypothetical protein